MRRTAAAVARGGRAEAEAVEATSGGLSRSEPLLRR